MIKEYLRQIVVIKHLAKDPLTARIGPDMYVRFLDNLYPILAEFVEEVEKLKANKKQETQQELPLWKKFPVLLSAFEKSHKFCLRMHFCQGRLSKLVHSLPSHF